MTENPNESPDPQPEDSEYPVGEPDPDVETAEPLLPEKRADADRSPAGLFQFTMAELLVTVAIVAFALGILAVFPRQYAAGLAGLGVLVSLLVIAVLQPDRPIVTLTWWAMFVVYLMLSISAMMFPGPAP